MEMQESEGIVLNGRRIRNAIEEAVYGVLNGPTWAAIKMEINPATIFTMLKVGHAKTRENARKLARLTAEAGTPIPAAELLALEDWQGPLRHPPGGRSSPRSSARHHRPSRRPAPHPVDNRPAAKWAA